MDALTPEEKLIHLSLMDMRNQSYAHNDPLHNILYINYNHDKKEVTALAQLNYHLFSHNSGEISALITKLKATLQEERDQQLEKLYPLDFLQTESKSRLFVVHFHSGFLEREVTDKG